MKKAVSVLVLILSIMASPVIKGESLVVNGIYQGKDLYVKNPFATDGVGFCVYEVYVNGELTRDEINSSAFAIDFNILGIAPGTPIEVILKHKSGCEPLILNPESIKPHSTFEITDISVDNNTLTWTAKNESGSLPFIVEQFRWNKWVKAGEVQGDGTADETTYKFKLSPYFGENKVRIKQVDYTDKPKYSQSITYNPKTRKITFEPKKPEDEINFSGLTRYEIFDQYGSLVKTGYAQTVDVSDLNPDGVYYLNYDNSFGETFKKK